MVFYFPFDFRLYKYYRTTFIYYQAIPAIYCFPENAGIKI